MMRIKWITMLGVAVLHIAGAPQRVHCCCLHPVRVFILIGASKSPSRVAAWIHASLSSVGGCLPS